MRGTRVRWLLVFVLVFSLLTSGAVRPRPARAVDTAVIIVSAVAGYVIFVFGMTWIIYGRKRPTRRSLVEVGPPQTEDEAQTVRFAPNCRSADGHLPLVCW